MQHLCWTEDLHMTHLSQHQGLSETTNKTTHCSPGMAGCTLSPAAPTNGAGDASAALVLHTHQQSCLSNSTPLQLTLFVAAVNASRIIEPVSVVPHQAK
jgi:hypothetical protein